jgi:hypothetical protein
MVAGDCLVIMNGRAIDVFRAWLSIIAVVGIEIATLHIGQIEERETIGEVRGYMVAWFFYTSLEIVI